MKITRSTLIACLLATGAAVMPIQAFAQFSSGPTTTKAWQQFKLNPKTKLKLNFKNASVDMVLELLSKASGITILKDPKLTSPITVVTPGQVTLDQAFSIVNTALGLQGYDLEKSGKIMVAQAKQQAPRNFNPDEMGMSHGSQTVLQVYKIQYANADQVAQVLNDIFSATPGQNNRLTFDFGGGPFGRRGGGNNQQQAPAVRASSDAYSNSVIVNASQDEQDQVAGIIKQIDVQTDQPLKTQVFTLKYADANSLGSVVQNVLTTQAPTGKGGVTSQQPSFGSRFQQFARFGNSQAGFGQVAVDTRSNSLIVSATEDNLKVVQQVVDELDKPIVSQTDTVVIPLENAKADVIAQLLQQAFGNRSGVNGAGYNPSKVSTTTVQNRANGANVSTSSGGASSDSQLDPTKLNAMDMGSNADNLRIALADPNADSGLLATNVDVTQRRGRGGGFAQSIFGGGGSGSQDDAGLGTTAVDANGRIINLQDISGQITVIPDTNTNSLIVVAPPQYLPVLRQVLSQLDQIPKQVVIETEIIEVTLNKSDQFGVEWKFAQSHAFGDKSKNANFGTTFGLQNANPGLQGFSYTLSGGDLSAFVNFLQSQTNFNVLATPRIFTSNNTQAQINISQRIPYITSTLTNSNGTNTFNYAFQQVGTILTVTPRITSNGYVSLDIVQTADDLQGYTSFNAPIVNQRQANTAVSVQDGRTVLIGGIIQDQVSATTNKLPILGDIPILGNLFKSTSKTDQRTELIVLMTPHIVSNSDDAEQLKNNTLNELTPIIKKQVDQIVKNQGTGPLGGTGSSSQTGKDTTKGNGQGSDSKSTDTKSQDTKSKDTKSKGN